MEITVTESVVVRPAQPTPQRTLCCSNLDLIFTRVHTPTLYFYRPPLSNAAAAAASFFDTRVLKSALAEVLVPFYPAAGRIRLGDPVSGRMEIECNGEGVVFVEAESDASLNSFGDFGPENGPEFVKLVPPVATLYGGRDVSACPLLLIQVTRFRCGGVSLGVALDHWLCDGFSALHLINSWADMARGVIPVTPPFIDRTVLAARNPPSPSFPHLECRPPPSIGSPQQQQQQPFVTASFRLTPADVACLKSKGKGPSSSGGGGGCTTFEAVAAHTWRCACLARGLPAEQQTRLLMPVSILGRLDPPLPATFMGNAIFNAVCDATAGQLVGESVTLDQVVGQVRAALARVDNAYVRSALDYIEAQPDPAALRPEKSAFGSPNLSVVSWVRLPIYAADFGWGRPLFMGPTKPMCEGKAYVIPKPSPEDGLSLVIGLHPDAMARFRKLFYDF